jgi:hypothetical protein
VLCVHDLVPNSVQISFTVVAWKSKAIRTGVTIWEGATVEVLRMEWLVNVSDVMNE